MHRVTIKDVAARAGVSFKMVSNVLNGHRASDKVRAAVLEAVKHLDYHPNQVARSMRTDQVLAKSEQRGYSLVFLNLNGSGLEPLKQALNSRRVDGAILLRVENWRCASS